MSEITSIKWISIEINKNLIEFLKKEITEYELAQKNMQVFKTAKSMHFEEISDAYQEGVNEQYSCGNHYYELNFDDTK